MQLSAGCRLHSSNKKPQNITDSKELTFTDSKIQKSVLFVKDLIKIHDFYTAFRKEIAKITANL